MHRLTWHIDGLSGEKLQDYFLLALVSSQASVMLQDADRRYIFIANLPDSWTIASSEPPTDLSLFGPLVAERLDDAKRRTVHAGDRAVLEIVTDTDRTFEFRIEAMASRNSDVQIITTIVEYTEERRKERLLKELLREVSHRSKNLLAVVQSIAAQTARAEGDLDGFLRKFRGRLYSLSHSQDLITDGGWRGASFFDLARYQINRHLPGSGAYVTVSGDNILLDPNATLHVGLALHELATNAVLHGDLLDGGRTVRLSARHTGGSDAPGVEIDWHESVALDAPRSAFRAGPAQFGSVILTRVVPVSVNGTARYDVTPDGVSYHLAFPYRQP